MLFETNLSFLESSEQSGYFRFVTHTYLKAVSRF
jgi:hypothetical protein